MVKWLIVADKVQTKIFKVNSRKKIIFPLATILNFQSRLKETDLVSDRSGRGKNNIFENSTHNLGETKKALRNGVNKYVKNISEYVKKAKRQDSSVSIILIAEPGLMGPLSSSFEKNKMKISLKIAKKYSQLKDEELLRSLDRVLA